MEAIASTLSFDYFINLVIFFIIPLIVISGINVYLFSYRVEELLVMLWEKIKSTVTFYFHKFIDFWVNTYNTIKNVLVRAWEAVRDFFRGLIDNGKDVVEKVKSAAEVVIEKTKEVYHVVEEKVIDVVQLLRNKFNTVINSVKSIFNTFVDKVSSVAHSIFGVVTSFINGVSNIASDVFGFFKSIFDSISSVVSDILDFIKTAIDFIINLPEKIADGIGNAISGAVSGVGDFFSNLNPF